MKTEKEIVEAYFEAHNRQDIDAVMPFYAEDATFEYVNNFTLVGKSALRQLEEYSVALNIKLKNFDYVYEPGQVSSKGIEQNDWLRTMGIDDAHHTSSTTIRDGLITSIQVELSQESREQMKQAQEPFMAWMTKEKPKILAELMADEESRITKQRALTVMALLHEWETTQT